MNLASIAMSMLTPAIVGRIASALGINPTMAQIAISAGLPAILGSIIGKAAQPSGLSALTGLLGQQNPSMLGNLGSLIGGAEQASLVSGGTSALTSLLGSSGSGALAGAVGKFAGLPDGASNGLLGMLAPVALGTIAQQQKASGLDASGLASMLAGQKDNIAAALPKGFGDLLKGTGLLDGLSGPSMAGTAATASAAAGAVKSAANMAGARAGDAVRGAANAMPAVPNPMMRWLPLAAAALLGLLAWNMLSSRTPTVPMSSKITYNNADVGAQASSIFDGLKSTITGIKDEASATASLPKLRDAATSLDTMRDIAGKLPADGRKNLAGIFAAQLPGLQSVTSTAIKAPGVESIIQPVMAKIIDSIVALAKG